MYINTRSKKDIEKSLCQVLNINKERLYRSMEECYNLFQKDHQIFVLDDQFDFFYKFVEKNQVEAIDQVMFIHLSRRLKGDEDNNGYSFVDTLTKKTSLSDFMKKYGIIFQYDDQMKMLVNGKEVDLDNGDESYSYYYLKNRFGFRYKDFDFKGYMLGDNIEKTDAYEIHEEGPEFFGYFFLFTDDQFIDDFYQQSEYYQFEYLVPLEMVDFEDCDNPSDIDKQRYIIVNCLQRLYRYIYDPDMNIYENRVISIRDTLSDCFLMNKLKNNGGKENE